MFFWKVVCRTSLTRNSKTSNPFLELCFFLFLSFFYLIKFFFILHFSPSSSSLSFSHLPTFSSPPPQLLLRGIRPPMGSHQNLEYQVEAGTSPSPPNQAGQSIPSQVMGSKKPVRAPCISLGPTARGPTDRPSHITIIHIQRA